MTDDSGLVFDDLAAWRAWQVGQQPFAVRVVRRIKHGAGAPPVWSHHWRPIGVLRRSLGRCPRCGSRGRVINDFCSKAHMRDWYYMP